MKAITNLQRTRDAAAILGAVTSATVVFSLVYFPVLEAFGIQFLAIALGVFAVVLVSYMIDYGLRTDLSYGLDLLLSGKFGKNWKFLLFAVIFLSFNLFRAGVTALLSWEGRKDVAQVAVKAPELQDAAAAKLQLDRAASARIASIEKQIAATQKAIRDAEASAGSSALRSLAASGNAWARGELSKARARASKAHRETLSELQATYTAILKTDAVSAAEAVHAISEANTAKQSRYQEITRRSMGYAGWLGAGATLIVIITSLLISLVNTAEQYAPAYSKRHESRPPDVIPVRGPEWDSRRVEVMEAKLAEMAREQKRGNTGGEKQGEKRGEKPAGEGVQKKAESFATGRNFQPSYKGSERDKLRRKIARYKRLAAADKLGEKGRKTLARMEKELFTMKNKKA